PRRHAPPRLDRLARRATGDDREAHHRVARARVGAPAARRRRPAAAHHRAAGGARAAVRAGGLLPPDGRPHPRPVRAPDPDGVPADPLGARPRWRPGDRGVIAVEAASGAYAVHCRAGALDALGALMREAGLRGAAILISDDAVAALHGGRACAALRDAGFEPHVAAFPAGEASKNLRTVERLYDALLDARAERTSPVVALGGGVVGDVAGFVAATYLRGVPFVQCPTSLLAMVDAAIGGKVGIDHARGKNLIGAFYPPRLVVEDPA